MWQRVLIVSLIGVHVLLVAYIGWSHFPTIDEMGHLPAGITHVREGRFSLYRVNPPLVRMIAAFPVALMGTEILVEDSGEWVFSREEFAAGAKLLESRGMDSLNEFRIARWACLPFTVLGAWACWKLAAMSYGLTAGLVAVLLWCTSPNILTYAAYITPDLGAASLGVAALLFFRRWLEEGSWRAAVWAGVWLGLAQLGKTTWIILFGLWPMLWALRKVLVRAWSSPGSRSNFSVLHPPPFTQLGLILVTGLYVLNAGYGFEGTGTPLGDYRFASVALTGKPLAEESQIQGDSWDAAGNRFEGTFLGRIPVPLPKNYLQGMDFVKYEFDRGYPSFLRGEWKHGGWWYYYLYAIGIKVPLGTLLIVAIVMCATVIGIFRQRCSREEIFNDALLLAPAFGVLILVSCQTGFNHHLRYALPSFPFFFVWAGKYGSALRLRQATDATDRRFKLERLRIDWRFARVSGTLALLSWITWSSLSAFPHSHSYFNELVGGPQHGWRHLHNSNVDWGQDLSFLKRWLDEHPHIKAMGIAPYHWIDLQTLGLPSVPPNRWPVPLEDRNRPECKVGPQPGWYAISLCHLNGEPATSYWGRPPHAYHSDPSVSYFQRFEAVDQVGYSMNIYYVSREQCNTLRAQMRLSPLPPSEEPDVECRD